MLKKSPIPDTKPNLTRVGRGVEEGLMIEQRVDDMDGWGDISRDKNTGKGRSNRAKGWGMRFWVKMIDMKGRGNTIKPGGSTAKGNGKSQTGWGHFPNISKSYLT